jgi:hypothetical protein
MTQEWDLLNLELAFAELGIQLMLSQSLDYNLEVISCSSIHFEYTRMSSMNTTMNWSNSSMKTEFMRYMKCAGTFINPNDMTRYS